MNDKTSFKDLIKDLSGRVDKSQDFTQDFMRGLVEIIELGLRTNGSVTISGFGKFELRWVEERKGINPQSQEEITIPGQNKVVFKPYKALREHVNKPYSRMEAQILDDFPDSREKSTPAGPGEGSPQKDEPEEAELSKNNDPFEPDDPNTGEIKNESAESGIEKKQAAAPFPFFIEEGDEEDDPDEELLIIKPSPVASQSSRLKNIKPKPFIGKETRDKGSFRWSYAAAGAAAALVVIAAVFYLLPEERTPDEITMIEPPVIESPSPPVLDENENGRIDSEETNLITIIIESGRSLWDLALEYLGDPYLWPWIFQVNSDIIDDPNVITSETELSIPVPADTEGLSDAELLEVAYGYISVYNWYAEQNSDEARNYLWAAGSFYPPVLDEIEGDVNADDLRFARSR